MENLELLQAIGGVISTVGVNGVLGFVAWKLWKALEEVRREYRGDMGKLGARLDAETKGRREDAVKLNTQYAELATQIMQKSDAQLQAESSTQGLLQALISRGE